MAPLVVIVEDDPDIREVLAEVLGEMDGVDATFADAAVRECHNGRDRTIVCMRAQ